MNIFISWSKHKSEKLAKETKTFLESVLNSVNCFFSPDMYKGTSVDHEIYQKLLSCNNCIVCLTEENYNNPWLMYEASVIYGSNYEKGNFGIVIPILFGQFQNGLLGSISL